MERGEQEMLIVDYWPWHYTYFDSVDARVFLKSNTAYTKNYVTS